jgi:hypothetical protein
MIPSALFLECEDGEVEAALVLGVADDFDRGDLSLREGEAECAEEPSFWSDDESDGAADEGRLCGARATGGGDGALRPIFRTADLSHGFDGPSWSKDHADAQ